jgi:hypothetical protein
MRYLQHACASIAGLVLLAGAGLALGQVEPPDVINYQGVLRDAAGHAESGDFEMIFRFFDLAGGGSELAKSEHCAVAGPAPCALETGAVTVTGGLFNVPLGSAGLIDGPGPGFYTGDLPGIFRDHQDVWMQIEIYFPGPIPAAGFQVLSPRVKVNSSAYSLNANHLDGFASTAFPKLTVGNTFTTGIQKIQTGAAATKGLIVQGAAAQTANLQEWQNSVGAPLTSITPSGAISWPGFGSSASPSATALTLVAGYEDTDDLILAGGNGEGVPGDGKIVVSGGDYVEIQAGGATGDVVFENGNFAVISVLDELGNLQMNGDLTVTGNDVFLDFAGGGPRLSYNGSSVQLLAGGATTDDVIIQAGAGVADGRIAILGASTMELRSGSGVFSFVNGPANVQTASLSSTGDLQIDGDLTVSNLDLTFSTTNDASAAIRHAGGIIVVKDTDNDQPAAWFTVSTNGGTIEQMRIQDEDEAATLFDGAVTANGIDYAEAFKVADPTLAAGEVVSFAFDGAGEIRRSAKPYDPNLAGVVSENPGFVTGNSFDAEEQADPEIASQRAAAAAKGDSETAKALTLQLMDLKNAQHRPVALAGRVPVKVDASYGVIQPGDHLTSSPTPGHAMVMKEPGVSLGIALEGFVGPGKGNVLVFVDRSYYTPPGQLEKTQAAQQKLAGQFAERTADPVTGLQTMDGNLQIVLDKGGDDQSRLSVFRDGEGAALATEVFRVDEDGNVYARGSFRPASLDLAEYHPVTEPVEVGDVLVVDRSRPGSLRKGGVAADPAVVGIVSAEPGVLMGSGIGRIASADADLSARLDDARRRGDRAQEAELWKQLETRFGQTHAAVALSGTVPCKVDATYGSIRVGDLLTASPTAGRAMRSADDAPGTILGKALEPLEAGTGTIKVLVMLR